MPFGTVVSSSEKSTRRPSRVGRSELRTTIGPAADSKC